MTEFVINYSFQIVGALIILIIGLKLSGWLSRLVLRLCDSRSIDITLSRFFASSTKLLVMMFVLDKEFKYMVEERQLAESILDLVLLMMVMEQVILLTQQLLE